MFISASAGIGRYFPRPVVSGASYLLDDYAGAEIALSLRKVSSTYTGSAIEVWNGTSLLDIGFDNGELDTTALAAHCGASNGFVSKWYDQSGNGNNFVQAVALNMPKIYDGATTSTLLDNGKPVMEAQTGSNMDLVAYTGVPAVTMFNVAHVNEAGSAGNCLLSNDGDNYIMVTQNGNVSVPDKDSGTVAYRTDGAVVDFSTRDLARDGMQQQRMLTVTFATSGGTVAYDNLTLGYNPNAGAYTMANMQEMILYNSDKSADITAIEDSINTFYDIYAPVHVFLLAGQSNMVGRATFDGGAGYPTGTLQYTKSTGFDSSYSDTTLIDAASPLGHWDAVAGDMGLAIDFVTDYVAVNGVNAVLIPAADGGTGFANAAWNPGNAQYNHAVSATNALMTANPTWLFQAVIWHQGESDSVNASFADNFYLMIQSMRNDITTATQSTPFILGELLAGGSATTVLNSGVLTDTPTYNYETALVSSAALTSGDNLHFDAASLRTFGSRYEDSLTGLSNPYPTEETGATGHWLLGNSNQLYIDLTGNGTNMTEVGNAPTYELGSTNVEGVTLLTPHGLDTGIVETTNMTTCAVFKYEAVGDLNIIMGNLGLQALTGGHAFFRNGVGDLRFNERSGTGALTLRTAAQMVVGNYYFIASSLDASDNYVVMVADLASTSFSLSGLGAGVRTLGTGRNLGVGNVHYLDNVFDGNTNVAELIVFNTAKTLLELEAIAGRSRTRLAARGVTVT